MYNYKRTPQAPTIQRQLSIQKALEFVGDNSSYQKRRLLILSIIILSTAILTSKIPLQGASMTTLFLIASGIGQLVCPIYMSLSTTTKCLALSTLAATVFYPIGGVMKHIGLLALGVFSRGFYVSALVYLNQIGGDRFRAWSMIVVFGIWGVSTLVSSIQKILKINQWVGFYTFIFLPLLVDSYFVMKYWQQSPFKLYTKRQFPQALAVLNKMAQQNERPSLPYALQGQNQSDQYQYKKPTYMDMLTRPILRKITIPLLLVWIYRQYIYYGSYLLIPEMGLEYSKNYILISISQSLAVLISYPIRIQVKRINCFVFCALLVSAFSLVSSFFKLDQGCLAGKNICAAKYIYRVSIFIIRFSASLMGNILVSYTLEIYPSNIRNLGFSLCLGISSFGSILIPWVISILLYVNLSGFIAFAVVSVMVFYPLHKLYETHGRMRMQTLEEMEQQSASVALKNWGNLNF